MFKPSEVAEILQISKYTVYEMIKRGDLKALHIGSKVRVEEIDLLDFKEKHKNNSQKKSKEVPSISTIKIGGSHDLALQEFFKFAQNKIKSISIQPSFVGSINGLFMLFHEQIDVGALHIFIPQINDYNLYGIKPLFIQKEVSLIRFAAREQGFIIQKGNPKQFNGFGDLTRKDITIVNRQEGSGTRLLFDYYLNEYKIASKDINGYEHEEWNHLATASYVASGSADVSFGIENAATRLNLDFIPVRKEYFDLVFLWNSKNRRILEKFYYLLRSDEFRESVLGFKGYDFSELGKIMYENKINY